MAPNTQEQEIQKSFTNSFWSRDKSGMNQLLDYMKSTHDDLDIIYTMYTERYIIYIYTKDALLFIIV